jgi:hypothetical protein
VFSRPRRSTFRAPPGRREETIEPLRALAAVLRLEPDLDLAVAPAHGADLGVRIERKFGRERLRRIVPDLGIAQGPHRPALAEQAHAHAQAMQRLAELEADAAAAEHRDRCGQVLPLEHVVAGHQQIADLGEEGRVGRPGARGDHDTVGLDHRVVADLETVVVDEAGVSGHAVRRRKVLDHLEHRADEIVAQVAHPLHHRAAVDARRADVDPEHPRLPHGMGRVGGGDQELARHAADASAGGAVRPDLDQDQPLGVLAHPAIRRKARGAGPDDRDVDVALRHRCPPR